jgi:hypothetical protein
VVHVTIRSVTAEPVAVTYAQRRYLGEEWGRGVVNLDITLMISGFCT